MSHRPVIASRTMTPDEAHESDKDRLRADLLDILSDPEFERELQRRRLLVKLGPPLSRPEDYLDA